MSFLSSALSLVGRAYTSVTDRAYKLVKGKNQDHNNNGQSRIYNESSTEGSRQNDRPNSLERKLVQNKVTSPKKREIQLETVEQYLSVCDTERRRRFESKIFETYFNGHKEKETFIEGLVGAKWKRQEANYTLSREVVDHLFQPLSSEGYKNLDQESKGEIAAFIEVRYEEHRRKKVNLNEFVSPEEIINTLTSSLVVPYNNRYGFLEKEIIKSVIEDRSDEKRKEDYGFFSRDLVIKSQKKPARKSSEETISEIDKVLQLA